MLPEPKQLHPSGELVPPERDRLERLEERFQEFRKQHQEYKAAQDEKERAWQELDSTKTGYRFHITILYGMIVALGAGWLGTGVAWITNS